ncbi:TIGR03032 family protein [Telmatocola sphagniphila]|uniref:TIGR03032 family protein n=1 Tax=Telmatocola sphagniphila TaxID=1123043 RepID=A0A8E6ESH3_9BACT|nr:TIGR03032 family protein [Telmatocola sphagniphila]QVL30724.1 TIGR03032 family protein [Telmatocola sphagniphila]
MAVYSQPAPEQRDVRCKHSDSLPPLLASLRLTLLLSTYQTGHLVAVCASAGKLVITFHQFDRAMGIAVKEGTIAVCTRSEVWFLRSVPDIAAKLEPSGLYDACFLARTSHFTGDIQAHEAAWIGEEFCVVNTRFSCISALHPYYSFAPRWRPPFITAYAPEDRCHLNGLAIAAGQPRYVTALAESDAAQGWRPAKAYSGCIVAIPTGQIVARGLSLPHSPRVLGERLYFLQSGSGTLDYLDLTTGRIATVSSLPGIARGLAIHAGYAFIGLSKARPSLEGVPIVADREKLLCGLSVIDLNSGLQVAFLEFQTGVDELFDIQVLPGIAFPFISGPWAERDRGQPFWTIPPMGK